MVNWENKFQKLSLASDFEFDISFSNIVSSTPKRKRTKNDHLSDEEVNCFDMEPQESEAIENMDTTHWTVESFGLSIIFEDDNQHSVQFPDSQNQKIETVQKPVSKSYHTSEQPLSNKRSKNSVEFVEMPINSRSLLPPNLLSYYQSMSHDYVMTSYHDPLKIDTCIDVDFLKDNVPHKSPQEHSIRNPTGKNVKTVLNSFTTKDISGDLQTSISSKNDEELFNSRMGRTFNVSERSMTNSRFEKVKNLDIDSGEVIPHNAAERSQICQSVNTVIDPTALSKQLAGSNVLNQSLLRNTLQEQLLQQNSKSSQKKLSSSSESESGELSEDPNSEIERSRSQTTSANDTDSGKNRPRNEPSKQFDDSNVLNQNVLRKSLHEQSLQQYSKKNSQEDLFKPGEFDSGELSEGHNSEIERSFRSQAKIHDVPPTFGHNADCSEMLITYLNSETGEMVVSSQRKLKGRPTKHGMSRNEVKIARNLNQQYVRSSGLKQAAKTVDLQYKCPCSKKCAEAIDNETKELFFDNFRSAGTYESRTAILVANCQRIPIKKGKTKKRRFLYIFSVYGVAVCKQFFLNLLGISYKPITNIFNKLHNKVKLKDYRGYKVGGKLRIDPAEKALVISHINRLPKYTSHYSRAQNDLNEYLTPGVTIYDTYLKYKSELDSVKRRAVSFSTYRRIMRLHFNIKAKILRKDSCNTCDVLAKKYLLQNPMKKLKVS